MALEDYKNDVEACSRCSSCKWVPHNQVKSWRFAKNCPSMCRYNFHAYSGSGKLIMVNSMINGRSELTEGLTEIIYKCQMCGACDAACKVYRDDIDITEILLELRANCVEQGQLIIEHMAMIDALKNEDNVLGEPKAKRGEWAEGLAIKNINTEQAEVFFHTGCRYSYDQDLRDTVRGAVRLMQSAGVDLGIAGGEESCCGGRAYELDTAGRPRTTPTTWCRASKPRARRPWSHLARIVSPTCATSILAWARNSPRCCTRPSSWRD